MASFYNVVNIKERKRLQRLARAIRKYIKKSPVGECSAAQSTLARAAKIDLTHMKDLTLKLLETSNEFIRYEMQNKKDNKTYHIYKLSKNPANQVIEYKEGYNIGTYKEVLMNFNKIEEWNQMDRMELIEAYLESGLDIIPVLGKKRVFTDDEWDTNYKENKVKIINFLGEHKSLGIAARQQGDIAIVDIDCMPQMLELLNGEVFDTLIAQSGGKKKGQHWWFKNTPQLENALRCFDKTFDVIARNNMYVVLPPSIHPDTGQPYQWLSLAEPIDVPQPIIDLYNKAKQTQSVFLPQVRMDDYVPHGLKRVKRGYSEVRAKVFPTEVLKDHRQPALFSYGRHLYFELHKPIDEVSELLHKVNTENCKPPKTAREMRDIIRQVQFGAHKPSYLKRLEQLKKNEVSTR